MDISWLILHFDFVYRDYQIYRDEALCLEGRAPFAEGGNRVCFVHPDDEGLCVKVVKAGSVAALRGKRSFWKNLRPDSYFDDNLNEYKAYQQRAVRAGRAHIYDHIPRCYGWQATDIGAGLVLDYYPDGAGGACGTLEGYLHAHGFTAEIEEKLTVLADYLRATQVMTKNILPHNVVLAADGRLKIIDGLGASSGFNIARFSWSARARYVNRRIDRMFLRARWESGDKAKSWTEVEEGD